MSACQGRILMPSLRKKPLNLREIDMVCCIIKIGKNKRYKIGNKRIKIIWGKEGENVNKALRKLTSFQVITMGFFSVIILGAFLLMLPVATRDGQGASFLDAFFTATSATCVTGLIVQNTATYWTGFGQLVILLLIQIVLNFFF